MADSVAIVGTGRLASALVRLLSERGVAITAIAGRSPAAVSRLLTLVPNACASSVDQIGKHAHLVLIAVSDEAIPVVDRVIAAGNGGSVLRCALHTSGASGPEALACLRETGIAIGVLHPLQTIPSAEAGYGSLPHSSFAYAGDHAACEQALWLIQLLDGHPLAIDPERWAFYHAAAVMASNYQVALVDAALELMEGAGISRPEALSALTPLITRSTSNILELGPDSALTGPIRRGDVGTVLRHVRALRNASPEIARFYAAAGRQALKMAARAGVDASSIQAMDDALAVYGSKPFMLQ